MQTVETKKQREGKAECETKLVSQNVNVAIGGTLKTAWVLDIVQCRLWPEEMSILYKYPCWMSKKWDIYRSYISKSIIDKDNGTCKETLFYERQQLTKVDGGSMSNRRSFNICLGSTRNSKTRGQSRQRRYGTEWRSWSENTAYSPLFPMFILTANSTGKTSW